jgi:hypothetical protein
MEAPFDPYLQWLGIRDPQRPPNHYCLLGVAMFESDPEVLVNAADRQMSHVRKFQAGKHSAQSQRLLNELAVAKLCLLNAEKKAAYDAQLQPLPPAGREPSTAAPTDRADSSMGLSIIMTLGLVTLLLSGLIFVLVSVNKPKPKPASRVTATPCRFTLPENALVTFCPPPARR